uniref:Apple domain-containing protein n=1 Tax=Panagrolaimus sp. JU765 TaxID=591449 RepID=A0AC34QY06_9BILA
MTIMGSDYRRDYGLSQKECADVCKMDSCCMAFEFVNGECTMKARSLNGTISPKQDAIFGLCLDFDDEDRDRFWDHELGGTVLEDKPLMERDACSDFCGSVENSSLSQFYIPENFHEYLSPTTKINTQISLK